MNQIFDDQTLGGPNTFHQAINTAQTLLQDSFTSTHSRPPNKPRAISRFQTLFLRTKRQQTRATSYCTLNFKQTLRSASRSKHRMAEHQLSEALRYYCCVQRRAI